MLPEPNFPVRPGEFVGRRPEIELQVYADSPIIVMRHMGGVLLGSDHS